jgi:tetratricopeptide (TPR) repeat protein
VSITADQLDPDARAELRTLPGDLADAVARLLVAAGLAEDAERGYEYAVAARDLAARVGVVRETCGIAAYRAGKWNEALAELRAARRLTGQGSYLPLMADCERALGRLDRALDLVTGPQTHDLDRDTQVELRIVESGIRRDQGFPEAGVVALQIPELTDGRKRPESARLFYAYADALADADRPEEARSWFGKAAAVDPAGETDAADRIEELDLLDFDDLEDADDLEDTDDLEGADEAEDADEAGDLRDAESLEDKDDIEDTEDRRDAEAPRSSDDSPVTDASEDADQVDDARS